MTAYTAFYRADRVVVCGDSRIYTDDGETVTFLPKVHTIPRLQAVYFSRGRLAITEGVVSELLTLDGAIEQAAVTLTEIHQRAASEWADVAGVTIESGTLFHAGNLMGWSPAAGRMRWWRYSSVDGFQANGASDRSYGGPLTWPDLPSQYWPTDRPSYRVETKLKRVLLAINRYCHDNVAEVGGAYLGGDITCTSVAEDEIIERVIGEIKPRKQRKR